MTDQWAIILAWFANYSNFYSVMSVLVCFCAMVVFILRLNGEHLMGSTATHYNVVKEQKMVSLHNPFSLKLQETKPSSIKAGLHLSVSVTKAAQVSIFWGVNIQAFQKELNSKTEDIASNYKEEKLFENKYLHLTDLQCMHAEDGVSDISAKCPPTVTEEGLGAPPRQMYPVVIVSILQDWDSPHHDNTDIVLQLTVFHMKDSICTLDSHIVYQFVKTRNDQVLSLQPIFMVTSDPDLSTQSQQTNDRTTSAESISATENTTEQPSCLACSQVDSTQPSQTQSLHSPEQFKSSNSISECTDNHLTASQCDIQTGSQCDFQTGSQCDGLTTSQDHQTDFTRDTESYGQNEETENTQEGSHENGLKINAGEEASHFSGIGSVYEELVDDGQTCIVCQSESIVYTLLPCRHACVCSSCIRQLERCPMCRSYIDAYFRLYDMNVSSEYNPSNQDTTDVSPTLSRWETWNQRLNEFLGFS